MHGTICGSMIVAGKLIEYLYNCKFICALVTESQPKRLRLMNQNGRELNLPTSRVIHCSKQVYPLNGNREALTKQLRDTTEKRCSLMNHINLEEIWELTAEDSSHAFTPAFLVELTFGEMANDDTVSAFLRCVFEDKLFFKYKEGLIHPNSPDKVEQIQQQLKKEEKKAQLINEGAAFIARIFAAHGVAEQRGVLQDEVLNVIRDYYLFGTEAAEA